MFNKTRRKIVVTVVLSLLALMAVTLTTIYLFNRAALQRENREMLKTYVERYSLEEEPGPRNDAEDPGGRPEDETPPEVPDDGRGKGEREFQLSTFYSVAYSKDGEVMKVNNGNNGLQSEDSLIEIASSILEKGKKSGKTGNMTYLVDEREEYTLVAMIDGTIGDKNQQTLIKQMLIIGGAAMAVLFALSVFIARRIVKPLEENDKRQKRFVSDAGHELKTPIAVISANSELLRREVGESEWLDNIDYENGRMSDLVKQLLVLSRAENGDLPKETIDFSKLVDGEVLPLETLAYEKGKEIASDTEPDIFVEGDPNRLRQLVSILLDNALYHGTGERIELLLRREKHSAALTVSNEADGIGAEQLSGMFERFYRADEARGDDDLHYGLGLSIAKAVTEAHGGEIGAKYADGKIHVTVTLPLKRK